MAIETKVTIYRCTSCSVGHSWHHGCTFVLETDNWANTYENLKDCPVGTTNKSPKWKQVFEEPKENMIDA